MLRPWRLLNILFTVIADTNQDCAISNVHIAGLTLVRFLPRRKDPHITLPGHVLNAMALSISSRRLLIIVLLATVASSCAPKDKGIYCLPEFYSIEKTDLHIISKPLMCELADDIFMSDGAYVVFHYNIVTDAFCNIYDEAGVFQYSLIHRGRGPEEVLRKAPKTSVYSGVLTGIDMIGDKHLSFKLDSLLVRRPDVMVEAMNYHNFVQDVLPVHKTDNRVIINNFPYLSVDSLGYHRTKLINSFDETIATQDYIPFPDKEYEWWLYQQTVAEISPDGKHFVVGSIWGAILELYSLPDLTQNNVLWLVDPALEINNGLRLTDCTTAGLRDIEARDDCFYAAIGTKVPLLPNRDKPVEERELECNDIYVFDWSGNPLHHIEVDYNIERFCLNEKADTLYAVVSDREENLFLGWAALKTRIGTKQTSYE